jgi:hypothetical protein
MWGGGIYTCNHNLDLNATIYWHPHFLLLIVLVYFLKFGHAYDAITRRRQAYDYVFAYA